MIEKPLMLKSPTNKYSILVKFYEDKSRKIGINSNNISTQLINLLSPTESKIKRFARDA